jgi:hypothetical protein
MATILYGDDETFNAMTSGIPHPSTIQFLEQERYNPTQQFAHYSQQFVDRTQQLLDWIENNQAARLAQAARRAIGQVWETQSIRHLASIAEFQWAPQPMVRWLMAEPSVRERYHQQGLEGYSGDYTDPFPEPMEPTEHLDYRHVMNGVVVMNPSNEGPEWHATTYYDDREDLAPMDFLDQIDVIHSWENLRHWITKGKDDPTSRFNASL